jgi:hypothetical protein
MYDGVRPPLRSDAVPHGAVDVGGVQAGSSSASSSRSPTSALSPAAIVDSTAPPAACVVVDPTHALGGAASCAEASSDSWPSTIELVGAADGSWSTSGTAGPAATDVATEAA